MNKTSPNTLYIDTSHDLIMALISSTGNIYSHQDASGFRTEAIDSIYTQLEQKHPIEIKKIKQFVVAVGPGSFTGLRTGIAYAQGLCVSSRRPIFTISSFSPILPDFKLNGPCTALIPAKQKHFYAMSNYPDGLGHINPILIHQDILRERSNELKSLVLAGSSKSINTIQSHFSEIIPAFEVYNFSTAIQQALLRPPVSHGIIKPNYVQLPAAELNRLKKMAQNQNDKSAD